MVFMCFSAFYEIKQSWAPFFPRIFSYFAQIFKDFAQIFNKSKLLGGVFAPPASYTTG